ncbi:hypothetical protein B9J78_00060 [bacterium Unc6]|nr:hypothetical protein [bacterium Unc6]
MKYAILGDIHSNLEALEAVLNACSLESVDRYVCVGDIVGYGADPEKCIKIVKELEPTIVCGNHDWGCVGLVDLDYFNTVAKEAIEWTCYLLSESDCFYLRSFPLIVQEKRFVLVHSTLDAPERFDYMFNASVAEKTLQLMTTPLCFIGHIHIPMIFQKTIEGPVEYSYNWKTEYSPLVKQIVSVGSVGQPRDGDPRACYVIYDSKKDIVEIKRVEYNVSLAQKKIYNAGLHPILASRLAEGR